MWTIFLISSNLLKKKKSKNYLSNYLFFFIFPVYKSKNYTRERKHIGLYFKYNYIQLYNHLFSGKQNETKLNLIEL